MHAYHDDLPGYSPDQLLFVGCPECEHRAAEPHVAIGNLDYGNFKIAWRRAHLWGTGVNHNFNPAEIPMFRVLWAVQVQFERRGIPLGQLP